MVPININNFGYNSKTKTLTVAFGIPTSCVYQFLDVPNDVIEKLRETDDMQSIFNELVRGQYRSKRIL